MYMFPKEPFCYLCHGKCCGIFCSNCWRSYCQNCAKKYEKCDHNSPSLWITKCSQCVQLEKSAERWKSGVAFPAMKEKETMSVFGSVIGEFDKIPKILREDSFDLIKKINSVHTPFSINNIRKRVEDSSYRCPEEMAIDLKIVEHILLASPKGNFDQKQLKETSEYLKYALKKLRLVDECPNCVLNYQKESHRGNLKGKGSYFLVPCPWPHALVLVGVKGCKRWPAKALCYNADKGKVRVALFGSHSRSSINLQSIFYARDPRHFPKDYEKIGKEISSHLNMRTKFDIAVRELKTHLKRLEDKFPGLIMLTSQPEKPLLPTDSLHLINTKVVNKRKKSETKWDELEQLLSPESQQLHVFNTHAEALSTLSGKSQLVVAMNELNRGPWKRVKTSQENCVRPHENSNSQVTIFEAPNSSSETLSSSQSGSITDSESSSHDDKSSSIEGNKKADSSIFNMSPGEERDILEAELKIRALFDGQDLSVSLPRLDEDIFWSKYHLYLDNVLEMDTFGVTSQESTVFQNNPTSVDQEINRNSKFIGNISPTDESSDPESLPKNFR
ncbi:uncharacterized protein LOC141849610 [Brevipalpus obovatus]|uniref:uncharacterized protein LOC141849610 n=1 Tax=Brevipalpus obovatus TaxID=246614 RepID=UPI003D9E7595